MVKNIECGNVKALGFLKNCNCDVGELWSRAKIEIVPLDQVSFHMTVRVWVPTAILEDKAILTFIKRYNKGLGVISGKSECHEDSTD